MTIDSFEPPRKRYITTINLTLPGYITFVDSWEEAEEQAAALLEDCVSEKNRSTTTVAISPLKRTKWFYEDQRQQREEAE